MAFTFNVCEVFEVAEQAERNSAKFCRRVADKCRDSHTRQVLLQLAEREEGHAAGFAAIRKELSERGECPPTAFDPEGEDALYLQAMADDHVFNVRQDPCERLTGGESPEQILQMAVELEKEALAFYLGLKATVPTASGKDKVEIIIKAKMRHIGILNLELTGLNK